MLHVFAVAKVLIHVLLYLRKVTANDLDEPALQSWSAKRYIFAQFIVEGKREGVTHFGGKCCAFKVLMRRKMKWLTVSDIAFCRSTIFFFCASEASGSRPLRIG